MNDEKSRDTLDPKASVTEKRHGKKTVLIVLIAAVVLLAAAAGLFFLLRGSNGYRTIRVFGIEGSAEVERESLGKIAAYLNMMLESGDRVFTAEESYLRLKLDSDKYMLLEPLTQAVIRATGNPEHSLTDIELISGAVVNKLEKKLTGDSSYTVSTPNSTMAVRGTSFRVAVEKDENGSTVTVISVTSGVVEVYKTDGDGNPVGEPYLVEAGFKIVIGPDGVTILPLDLSDFDAEVLDFLGLLFNGKENADAAEDGRKKYTVTFIRDGKIFGAAAVREGDRASVPQLRPADNGGSADGGHWDFDFDTPITSDLIIEWKE